MTDRLFIFQKSAEYAQTSEDSERSFDVSLYGNLLDADIGWALTTEGEPLSEHHVESLTEDVLDIPWRSVASGFHERFVVTDDELIADQVRLRSGETAPIDSYDTVIVTQVVFHAYYIQYLRERFPDLTLVGVQDESIQDVLSFSPQLQLYHLESLSSVDGFISEGETYRRWVTSVVDDVLFVPLLIPNGQFDGLDPSSKRTDTLCLGSATHNVLPSNFYSSVVAFQRLREMGHGYEGEIVGVTDWQAPSVGTFESAVEGLEVTGFIDDGFYEYLTRFDIAILPTARVSAGRLSAELAAAGVPCIGNAQNDLQRRCFPDLCVTPFDTSRIVSLAHRLATDERFYENVLESAQETVAGLQEKRDHERRLRAFVSRLERN